MVHKLYLIVRGDLPPGAQAVQAAHALQAFNVAHPHQTKVWHEESNTLALLAIPNEAALGVLLENAIHSRIPVAPFREPDRGDELTAIALGPQGKRLTKNLPLALVNGREVV